MLSLFPRDVSDDIWDLIESVSDGFLPSFLSILELYDECTESCNEHAFYYSDVPYNGKLHNRYL